MGFKVLIVEDEEDINEILSDSLKSAGLIVESCFNLSTARKLLKKSEFNLVVLDMNLPDGTGTDLIKELKKAGSETSILVLTANNLPQQVDQALLLGVSDYMIKPFRSAELILRINNILNRAQGGLSRSRVYSFGHCVLDYNKKTVLYNGRELNLNSKEFNLLHVLMVNQGKVVSRDFVYQHLWGSIDEPDFHRLESTLSNLRKKLKSMGRDFIRTKAKVGYYLE